MEIAGKVQVDILHRNDLCVTAAGGAALDAEHGSQGGLAQCDRYLFPDPGKTVRKSDCRCGFSLAGRGGRDRGDKHQFSFFCRLF